MSVEVVVTGMGVVTSAGVGKKCFWDTVSNGRSSFAPIRRFDTEGFRCRIGAQISDELDPGEVKTSRKLWDLTACAGLIAAREALADAEVDIEGSPLGLFWGSAVGGIISLDEQFQNFYSRGHRWVTPATVPKTMLAAPVRPPVTPLPMPSHRSGRAHSNGVWWVGQIARSLRDISKPGINCAHCHPTTILPAGLAARSAETGMVWYWVKRRSRSCWSEGMMQKKGESNRMGGSAPMAPTATQSESSSHLLPASVNASSSRFAVRGGREQFPTTSLPTVPGLSKATDRKSPPCGRCLERCPIG